MATFNPPKRYCSRHGLLMTPGRKSIEYDTKTGELNYLFQYYSCPKWFCTSDKVFLMICNGIATSN